MSEVSISRTETHISVKSPYNSLFVSQAKKWNGKFQEGVWSFDIRDAERVVDLCRHVYGNDGVTSDTCTIRISMPTGARVRYSDISIHGFTLAKKREYPWSAKAASGVILPDGGFSSDGTEKRWEVIARKGTTVLLRDFPRHEAEKYVQEPPNDWVVSIENEDLPVNVDALTEEKERLLLRLSEIDKLIASVPSLSEEAGLGDGGEDD